MPRWGASGGVAGAEEGGGEGDVLAYECRRGRSRVVVRAGAWSGRSSEAGDVLTTRWVGRDVTWHGRTLCVPNDHPEWPLHRASLLEPRDDLAELGGVAVAGEPVSVLYSPGVPARFGAPFVV
ncbi:DUF2071 domain-containing protein [Amycolatopsis sp. DSM 110486]|uniref:DUF2071 domain-containing protein n=1 Tax=Amycolatopsis sp. DSM 110486 TaxID=2865832 RepID=UPI001C69B550|nr:DUF2071 domain-containing protein [Amycolatopsis sp. DSM 110486]QYN18181.1 DUF2071 domain-containing protein [Amycolatopsis sp. DSM 110486]